MSAGLNGLQLLMRFIRTVRLRKNILLASLVIACAVGMVYFMTATRFYSATGKLMIVEMGGTADSGEIDTNSARSNMVTFQHVMESKDVIGRRD